MLKRNPPNTTDYAVLLRMERIGLVAGQSFDLTKADPAVQRALTRAAPDAYKRFRERGLAHGHASATAGAGQPAMIGVYGNDYLLRAFIAFAGLGALPPEEATYPIGRQSTAKASR